MASPVFCLVLIIAFVFLRFVHARYEEGDVCADSSMACANWVAEDPGKCFAAGEQMLNTCPKSCQTCGDAIPAKYDLRRVPENLRPIAFLIGKWRSEHGGKAFFPTIPKFTYGEEIEFSLSSETMTGLDALNYTAFAWDNNDMIELHSENGFITVQNGSRNVALTTVMSNDSSRLDFARLKSPGGEVCNVHINSSTHGTHVNNIQENCPVIF